MSTKHCERCGGEGKLYTSRHGGNDPDVWPIGECPVCEGTGYEPDPVEEDDYIERVMFPRPHPLHPMFRLHNCAYCSDGERPCRQGNPSRCEYPHARND